MLVSVGVILPIANSTAHGLRQSSVSQNHRRYRRHSRAWWRRHRARMRLRRAAAIAALAQRNAAHSDAPLSSALPKAIKGEAITGVIPKLPEGWSAAAVNTGEV